MTVPQYRERRRGRSPLTPFAIPTMEIDRRRVVEARPLKVERFQRRQLTDFHVFKVAERVLSNFDGLQTRTLFDAKEPSRRLVHVLVIATSEAVPSNLHQLQFVQLRQLESPKRTKREASNEESFQIQSRRNLETLVCENAAHEPVFTRGRQMITIGGRIDQQLARMKRWKRNGKFSHSGDVHTQVECVCCSAKKKHTNHSQRRNLREGIVLKANIPQQKRGDRCIERERKAYCPKRPSQTRKNSHGP